MTQTKSQKKNKLHKSTESSLVEKQFNYLILYLIYFLHSLKNGNKASRYKPQNVKFLTFHIKNVIKISVYHH